MFYNLYFTTTPNLSIAKYLPKDGSLSSKYPNSNQS